MTVTLKLTRKCTCKFQIAFPIRVNNPHIEYLHLIVYKRASKKKKYRRDCEMDKNMGSTLKMDKNMKIK
jgi:hypothetical protein